MSIDRCARCDAIVDTDFDDDCYVEEGNMRRLTKTVCYCKYCREDLIAKDEELRYHAEKSP